MEFTKTKNDTHIKYNKCVQNYPKRGKISTKHSGCGHVDIWMHLIGCIQIKTLNWECKHLCTSGQLKVFGALIVKR